MNMRCNIIGNKDDYIDFLKYGHIIIEVGKILLLLFFKEVKDDVGKYICG